MKFIGHQLRSIRKRKDISQKHLAILCNFSQQYLSALERNHKKASQATICTILRSLSISLEEFESFEFSIQSAVGIFVENDSAEVITHKKIFKLKKELKKWQERAIIAESRLKIQDNT